MIVALPNTHIKIEVHDTSHGPEIAVMDGQAVTTVTIFEFECFVHEAKMLASTARAKCSARARHTRLPMR